MEKDVKAEHGEKMIRLTVYLSTNKIASGAGKIDQKKARAQGMVQIQANEAHGIAGGTAVPFNSMLEIGIAIEEVLIEAGVKLRPSAREKKYRKRSQH
jgi:hypothetical protein